MSGSCPKPRPTAALLRGAAAGCASRCIPTSNASSLQTGAQLTAFPRSQAAFCTPWKLEKCLMLNKEINSQKRPAARLKSQNFQGSSNVDLTRFFSANIPSVSTLRAQSQRSPLTRMWAVQKVTAPPPGVGLTWLIKEAKVRSLKSHEGSVSFRESEIWSHT